MSIKRVERLVDQGSNGSAAYEWATKIALEKTFRPNILRSRMSALVPPFRKIVSHTWSVAYLLKSRGAHYRKAQRITSKTILKAVSDWVGGTVWGSPVVALAPPYTLRKQHNSVYVRECSSRASPYVLLGVSKGAREAKISYSIIYETKDGTRD